MCDIVECGRVGHVWYIKIWHSVCDMCDRVRHGWYIKIWHSVTCVTQFNVAEGGMCDTIEHGRRWHVGHSRT